MRSLPMLVGHGSRGGQMPSDACPVHWGLLAAWDMALRQGEERGNEQVQEAEELCQNRDCGERRVSGRVYRSETPENSLKGQGRS